MQNQNENEQNGSSKNPLLKLIAKEILNELKELKEPLFESKTPQKDEVQFLNNKEACAFLGRTPQCLARYVKAGKIPKFVKGGRGNMYKKADLIKFLENGSK